LSDDSPERDVRQVEETPGSFPVSEPAIMPASSLSEASASPLEGGGRVLLGVLVALVLQLCQLVMLAIYPPGVLFLGATQLVYIIPAVVIARSKGQPRLGIGIIIGAALVFLLNATCWGFVLAQFGHF
jgi:hypothetical protein